MRDINGRQRFNLSSYMILAYRYIDTHILYILISIYRFIYIYIQFLYIFIRFDDDDDEDDDFVEDPNHISEEDDFVNLDDEEEE